MIKCRYLRGTYMMWLDIVNHEASRTYINKYQKCDEVENKFMQI